MATRQDDTGSRLWRGMRALIFGEDSEQTLRDEIEEAAVTVAARMATAMS